MIASGGSAALAEGAAQPPKAFIVLVRNVLRPRVLRPGPDRHPYELFLQLEGIEHRKTRVKRPQSNGIVERFHRTLLDEHFRVKGRRTWFETVEEMQAAPNAYLSPTTTSAPTRVGA